MTQHDLTVDNQPGLQFRQDLNNGLQALGEQMTGPSPPPVPRRHMTWFDTSVSPTVVKVRNQVNTAWQVVGHLYPDGYVPLWKGASFGSAALTNYGTNANQVVLLQESDPPGGLARLPAVDGSLLQELPIPPPSPNTSLIGVGVFPASGTYTKNANAGYVLVFVVGGGGSGAARPDAGSGGGGGMAMKYIANSQIGATETITVGAGGAPATGDNGNAGGTSAFGAHCSATGGAPGRDGNRGGSGGNGVNGLLNSQGQAGSNLATGTGGFQMFGGQGGRSAISGSSEAAQDGVIIVFEFV